jgi:hypothetical protein
MSASLATWAAAAALVLAAACGASGQVVATGTAAFDREAEPNDRPGEATPLREGRPMRGERSHPRDVDWFAIDTAAPGPRHFTVRRFATGTQPVTLRVDVTDAGSPAKLLYSYRCGPEAAEHHFYPVFERGPHRLSVEFLSESEGQSYELRLDPFEGPVGKGDVAAAEAAIDRGVARLLAGTPTGTARAESLAIPVEAMALAALCEGKGARERAAVVDRDLVGFLEARLAPSRDGGWRGEPVFEASPDIYQQAIVTLALAQAAGAGSQRARKLCGPAAGYLLASQLSRERSTAWGGPVDAGTRFHGGWRYKKSSPDADISVAGWCLAALAATDAAGIVLPGADDAAGLGVEFVTRCIDYEGFHYQPGNKGPSDIHDAIGAFVCLLAGDQGVALAAARRLDLHLPAVTQVDRGEQYPLYYAYYATRALYLRGGPEWETWRAATLRQLVRAQAADGSWPPLGKDVAAGRRFATALGVIILRTCLDEAPVYLKREVRGF